MGVGAHRDTEGASKTEVSELEVIMLVDEQILWLQVAVKNPVRVAVQKTGGELVSEFLLNEKMVSFHWVFSGDENRKRGERSAPQRGSTPSRDMHHKTDHGVQSGVNVTYTQQRVAKMWKRTLCNV